MWNSCDGSGESRAAQLRLDAATVQDRKSTRLNSSHQIISYAVFCLKKKKKTKAKHSYRHQWPQLVTRVERRRTRPAPLQRNLVRDTGCAASGTPSVSRTHTLREQAR